MEIRYVQTDRQKQMGGEQTGQDYFQQIFILLNCRNIFTVFGGYSFNNLRLFSQLLQTDIKQLWNSQTYYCLSIRCEIKFT